MQKNRIIENNRYLMKWNPCDIDTMIFCDIMLMMMRHVVWIFNIETMMLMHTRYSDVPKVFWNVMFLWDISCILIFFWINFYSVWQIVCSFLSWYWLNHPLLYFQDTNEIHVHWTFFSSDFVLDKWCCWNFVDYQTFKISTTCILKANDTK